MWTGHVDTSRGFNECIRILQSIIRSFFRTFKVKWLLQVLEKDSRNNSVHEVYAGEDFIFRDQSLTARWNDTVNLPPLSKIKTFNLYATMSVFYDGSFTPCKNRYNEIHVIQTF